MTKACIVVVIRQSEVAPGSVVGIFFAYVSCVSEVYANSSTWGDPEFDLSALGNLTFKPVTSHTAVVVLIPSIPEFNICREESSVWIVSLCPHGEASLWV